MKYYWLFYKINEAQYSFYYAQGPYGPRSPVESRPERTVSHSPSRPGVTAGPRTVANSDSDVIAQEYGPY